ncbi:hypothetical protein CL634_00375, partial [bacterium]|nr:hypothetical protein [bacterium]
MPLTELNLEQLIKEEIKALLLEQEICKIDPPEYIEFEKCMRRKGHYTKEGPRFDQERMEKARLEYGRFIQQMQSFQGIDVTELAPDITPWSTCDLNTGQCRSAINTNWKAEILNALTPAWQKKRRDARKPRSLMDPKSTAMQTRITAAHAEKRNEARMSPHSAAISLPLIDIDDGLDQNVKFLRFTGYPGAGDSLLGRSTGQQHSPQIQGTAGVPVLEQGQDPMVTTAIKYFEEIYPEGIVNLAPTMKNFCTKEVEMYLKKYNRRCWAYRIKAPTKDVCRHMIYKNLDEIIPHIRGLEKQYFHRIKLKQLRTDIKNLPKRVRPYPGKKFQKAQRQSIRRHMIAYRKIDSLLREVPSMIESSRHLESSWPEDLRHCAKGQAIEGRPECAEYIAQQERKGISSGASDEEKWNLVDRLMKMGIKCWPISDFDIYSYNVNSIGPGITWCPPVGGAEKLDPKQPHRWLFRSRATAYGSGALLPKGKDIGRALFGDTVKTDAASACTNLGWDGKPFPCVPTISPETGDRVLDPSTG